MTSINKMGTDRKRWMALITTKLALSISQKCQSLKIPFWMLSGMLNSSLNSKIGNQEKNVWSHVQDIFYILLRFLIRQGSDGELLLGGRIKGEMSVNVIIIHVKLCLA